MKEAGVVIDLQGLPLHWHLPPNRTVVALPDSRNLWDVFWENRERIRGFAHSHPGSGTPGPSWEDVTTFAAIEAGLGRRLDWWITSEDGVVLLRWLGPGKHTYAPVPIEGELQWLDELRRVSRTPEAENDRRRKLEEAAGIISTKEITS